MCRASGCAPAADAAACGALTRPETRSTPTSRGGAVSDTALSNVLGPVGAQVGLMAAGDLYALCREYLDACEAALTLEAPGGFEGFRSYVSPGPPAWDCCPQLTVHAGGPAVGDTLPLSPPLQPGHRIEDGTLYNMVAMTATVIRCTPTVREGSVQLPDAVGLESSAELLLGDIWAIWNYIATAKRYHGFWAPKEREVFFLPAVALNAAGGCAGWQMEVRVQLGGYRTVSA